MHCRTPYVTGAHNWRCSFWTLTCGNALFCVSEMYITWNANSIRKSLGFVEAKYGGHKPPVRRIMAPLKSISLFSIIRRFKPIKTLVFLWIKNSSIFSETLNISVFIKHVTTILRRFEHLYVYLKLSKTQKKQQKLIVWSSLITSTFLRNTVCSMVFVKLYYIWCKFNCHSSNLRAFYKTSARFKLKTLWM